MPHEQTGLNIFHVILIVLILVYFVPAILAYSKRHKNRKAILLLNIFGGITYFGWVLALVWVYYKE
jgi:hypothetical protein